jgi:hypothetical protein
VASWIGSRHRGPHNALGVPGLKPPVSITGNERAQHRLNVSTDAQAIGYLKCCGTIFRARRFFDMTPITEQEVAVIAHYMGYDLSRFGGYQLSRVRPREEPEIIVASTLELIADFLTH